MICQHRTIPERDNNFDLLSQQNNMVKLWFSTYKYIYKKKKNVFTLWINLAWHQAIAKLCYNLVFQKRSAPFDASFFLTPTWNLLSRPIFKRSTDYQPFEESSPQNLKHLSSPCAFVNINHFGAVALLNSVMGLQTNTRKGYFFRIYTWIFFIKQHHQNLWVKSFTYWSKITGPGHSF